MRVKSSNKKLTFVKKRNKITSYNIFNSRFNRQKFIDEIRDFLRPKNLRHSTLLLSIIMLAVVVPFALFNANALENMTQTNWSGGVGTDMVNKTTDPADIKYFASVNNLDDSTTGELNFGLTPTLNATDWCNTTSCNGGMLYRKLITINNPGDAVTNKNIEVSITYDSGMKANFSDIRFLTSDSTTELGYYFNSKLDSTNANAIVKIPTLPTGESSIYMYFGDPTATTSTSSADNINLDLTDGFDSGVLGSQWQQSSSVIVANNEATIKRTNYSALTPTNYSIFDRSVDRVFDAEIKIDVQSPLCEDNGDGSFYYTKINNVSALGIQLAQPETSYFDGPCDSTGLWYFGSSFAYRDDLSYYNISNGNYDTYNFQPRFRNHTYYQLRMKSFKDGGIEYWYSIDNGQTYHKFYDMGKGTTTNGPGQIATFNNNIWDSNYYNINDLVIRNVNYYSIFSNQVNVGIKQYKSGATGSLSSVIFNMGEKPYYDIVEIGSVGDGITKVQIRTDSNADMSTASDWVDCNLLSDGDDIYSSTCVKPSNQYLEYRLFMSSIGSDVPIDQKIESINFKYENDTSIPTANATSIIIKETPDGRTIKSDSKNNIWSTRANPYISWTPATDNVDGSGIAGYCIYFGTDSFYDNGTETQNEPTYSTTAGLITDPSQVDTNGLCKYAISGTSIDTATLKLSGSFTSGDTIRFFIKAFDKSLNFFPTSTQATYLFDNDTPDGQIYLQPESSNVSNTPATTLTWLYVPEMGLGVVNDDDSGAAGIKYCIADAFSDNDARSVCDPDDHPENWLGPNGAAYGTDAYLTDVWQPGDMKLTTNPNDSRYTASVLGEGNGVYLSFIGAMDNAGNIYNGDGMFVISKFTTFSSGKPQGLTVDPAETNSINSFSFNWDAPAATDSPFYSPEAAPILQLLEGSRDNFSYCWSVNVPINAEGTNCTRTAKGVTELPVGPYATKQGVNTLYIMTINEAGNFASTIAYHDDETDEDVSINNMAEIEFTADTIAPGIPQNVEVIDVSTLLDPVESSIWRLALSWTEPTSGVTTVNSYRILRSTDGINFTEIMSVPADNLSYIDLGLSQLEYSYKVMACDNAGSCGIASNVVGMTPTGRYTAPALLSDGPYVDPISTRKATISWTTNRVSDSKVFLSTTTGINIESGKYDGGDVTKTTDHSVELNNLQAGTKYYYVATWTDGNGNVGKTDESSFTTLPAPVISEVNIKNISVDGSIIDFSVENASKLNMYYGKSESFGGVASINTSMAKSNYSIPLSGLDDDSKYFIRLNGFDADGNEYQGNTYSFTTIAKPRISNLRFQPVADASSNTTMVTWTTNVLTSSELSYGVVGEAQLEVIDSKLKTEHEITVSNLIDDKEYTLVARSRDTLGNLAVSDIQTFRTALDTRPPKISAVSVETAIKGSGAEARGQIIISWTTDEPGTSQVAYGQGTVGSYGNKTSEDSRLSYEHTVVISDLSTSSIYQVQPISNDKARNEAKGTNQSAIIGRGTEDVFTIIFSSLRNIFGIKG